MFRKTIVTVAAAALLSAAALSPASAKPWGNHHGGLGLAFGALGLFAATAAATAATAPASCLQEQFVPTPRGYYKRVIVNVCDQ
jgi:hypothetical protein